MRWTWLALTLFACTRTHDAKPIAAEKGTPSPPPTYDAAPDVLVPADTAPPGPKMAAWTDPDVIAQLTASCQFAPPRPENELEESPLSCGAWEFEQSCLYDPCFDEEQQKCKPNCKRSCETCAAKCTGACEACKKPCQDDSCKRACATTCGACRQECLTEKDRCVTGTCAEGYTTCKERWEKRYEKSKCPAACPQFKACLDKCPPEPHWDCAEKCRERVRAACPRDLMTLCEAGGG
jgi:hypothetical protein